MRRLLALLLPLALVAAACGGDDDDGTAAPETTSTTAAAAPEDASELVIYSGRDEALVAPLIEQFEASSGYDVSVRYGSSAEMGAALLEEGARSPAHVFLSQEVGAVGVLDKAGLLAELPTAVVERADERFRPADSTNWVGITGRSRVIVYNTDLVTEVPEGVLDLTDERYRGQVAWVPGNASFQAFITGFRVSQGEDAAREWLEAMIANGAQEYSSNGDVLTAVDNGEIAIGLINHYYWARLLAEVGEDGINSQLVFPTGGDPGGLVNATAAGILRGGAEHPGALAFVEFLLSEEGQTYFVEETQEYPVVPGIGDPDGVPPLDELDGPAIDLTDLDSLEASQALLTEVGLLS